VGEAAIFPRSRVTIVGVLNVTPDSFSDGGRLPDADSAVDAALAMARDGAHVIDVGGESTRPGARAVPAEEEIARVVPVIEAIAKVTSLPISIDTRKSAVARAALEAGARVVNDVSGGRFDPGLLAAAAEFGATLILGHLRGVPETMQDAPHFDDVLAEVADELAEAAQRARAAGVLAERLVFDPGIGFGTGLADYLALLAEPGWLAARLGGPVLVGPSRKSFLGRLTGDPVERRGAATTAAGAVAVFAGADALRVHDVAAGVRAARVGRALRSARRGARRP
jgi:dihydropteroate synthase